MADDSSGYLENTLFWELEESDYDSLDVPEECMRIVRGLHDGKYLGHPVQVDKKFNRESNIPVYYIMDHWPYKSAPATSVVNGRTGVSTEAQKPDPDYAIWDASRDRINMWHDRLSRTVGHMCSMYWDPDFPKLNHNATYETRNGGLARVGGDSVECMEAETEPTEPEEQEAAQLPALDTSNPDNWPWNYQDYQFPETMQQVDRMASPLKQRGNFKYGYDFGKRAFHHPSSEPSLARSISVVRKYHLFAIARALILKSRGVVFPWQYVYNSTIESIRNNSQMDEYRSVIREELEYGREADRRNINRTSCDIVDSYRKYLEGNIHHTGKKFADATGQPWDISHFVIELRENLHLDLPRFEN